ncbi:MAG: SH3 domain-containing protein [Deferribacteraceae bacterium]|jgi:hypothetical protein|nr:SH3 domain-containing protein [Deferribacteraceae bacterium]
MKSILSLFIFLFILAGSAWAQVQLNFDDNEDPEEQQIPLPWGENFEEGPTIDDVIEGVGTITYSAVPVYEKPEKSGKPIRYAIPGEKVIIIANNSQWFNVRMYNGKNGFMERRYLKTAKLFYNESYTTFHMDKRVNVELQDMVKRFNDTLADSMYSRKFKVIPRINIVSSVKKKEEITLTIEYSAVDNFGMVVPSRQENTLKNEVRNFVELLFMRLLPTGAERYIIVVQKPIFSATGRVINTQGKYAEIALDYKDVDVSKLKGSSFGTIYAMAKSDVAVEKLFEDFPH